MHKLIYLMPRLETVEAMVSTLRAMKLGDDAYRVISRDEDGIRQHHLRNGTLLDQTDLLHMLERGLLSGVLLGLLLALALTFIQPFGMPVSPGGFVVAVVIGGIFGVWVGGMAGLANENYKLTPFHDALEHGQYLVMVRMRDPRRVDAVRQTMLLKHPEAIFMADDDTLTNPFASRAEYPQHHAR